VGGNAAGKTQVNEFPEGGHEAAPGSEVVALVFASPPQLELLEALRRLHPRLGQTYEGALRTFLDDRNPDCLAQCAHSIRELFDALPLVIRQPPQKPESLKAKVRQIADAWARAMDKTGTLGGDKWSGEVDNQLSKVLAQLTKFFKWFDEEHPKHAIGRDLVLDHFDPGHKELPPQLRQQRARAFDDVVDYMNSVAHHFIGPSRQEFAAKIVEAETVIRTTVKPAPYADRKTIDAILKGDA
jgi:hypothetical protein